MTTPFTSFPIPTALFDQAPFTTNSSGIMRNLDDRFNDIINAKDYGAIGDGITDDTTAIQNAIAAAAALSSSLTNNITPRVTVLFPNGNYLCGDVTLSYGAVLVGVGAVLTQKLGSTNILVNSANGGIYDCGAVNLTFQGLGTGSTAGIAMTYCSRGIFADNNFNNFGHQGLLIGSGTANFISQNYLQNCVLSKGGLAQTTGALQLGSTDDYVYNNEATCSSGSLSSSNLYAAACYLTSGGANSFISSNVFEISDVGLVCSSYYNRFVNNRCDTNYGPGYKITGNYNQFTNELSLNNSRSGNGSYSGFLVTGTAGNMFSNCLAEIISGNNYKYGFEEVGNLFNFYANCLASGNFSTWSIPDGSNSSVIVPPGTFNAGGTITNGNTTPSVDNQENWLTNNSAPTTITNFTSGVTGQRLCIFFNDSNTSIASGSGIFTPTGATVGPYVGGQVQQFVKVGSNWWFASHQP